MYSYSRLEAIVETIDPDKEIVLSNTKSYNRIMWIQLIKGFDVIDALIESIDYDLNTAILG